MHKKDKILDIKIRQKFQTSKIGKNFRHKKWTKILDIKMDKNFRHKKWTKILDIKNGHTFFT